MKPSALMFSELLILPLFLLQLLICWVKTRKPGHIFNVSWAYVTLGHTYIVVCMAIHPQLKITLVFYGLCWPLRASLWPDVTLILSPKVTNHSDVKPTWTSASNPTAYCYVPQVLASMSQPLITPTPGIWIEWPLLYSHNTSQVIWHSSSNTLFTTVSYFRSRLQSLPR